jgi:GNAT superfamily N-acetyltransferase
MKTEHNNTRLSIVSENDISSWLDHAIRKTLVECFPADREYFQARSWWHCVPIYRVLGRGDGDSIIAHVAIVERTVSVGHSSSKVRVAGVQGFCVLPGYRGTGLSDKMMAIAVEEANKRGFEAGLLFCQENLQAVYSRMGWHKLDSDVYMSDDQEGKRLIPTRNITMFYPIGTKQFPTGDIDLAGTDW